MKNYNHEEITRRIEQLRTSNAMTNNEFARLCDVDQGNLSKARAGKMKYSERVLMKIARATKVSFDWLSTGCGLCGTEGDAALGELDRDFQVRRGNATVVGDNNNVSNNVYGKADAGIDDGVIRMFSGVGGLEPGAKPEDVAKRMFAMQAEIEGLRKENEMKDRQIEQLEKDKAFYQSLLRKG